MPVILPILVAVGTAVGASAAAAAVVGGLIVAGTAMTVVGAATGNQSLMKWGSILSLAGGIGGLASGAWAGTASSVAASSAAGEVAVDSTGTNLFASEAAAYSGSAEAAVGAAEATNAAAPAASEVGTMAPADGLVNSAPAADAAAVAEAPAIEPATSVNTFADATPAATPPSYSADFTGANPAAAETANYGTNAPTEVAQYQPPAQYQGTGTSPASGGGTTPAGDPTTVASNNFWGDSLDKLSGWVKQNPAMAKAAGGLVQGAANNYGQQEAMQKNFDLQQDAIRNNRARYTASLQGLSVPVYKPPANKAA